MFHIFIINEEIEIIKMYTILRKSLSFIKNKKKNMKLKFICSRFNPHKNQI